MGDYTDRNRTPDDYDYDANGVPVLKRACLCCIFLVKYSASALESARRNVLKIFYFNVTKNIRLQK